MRRIILFAVLALGCSSDDEAPSEPGTTAARRAGDVVVEALPATATDEDRARARLDADFPRYGAVTGTQLRVLIEPNEAATVLGWLRIGARVRLGAEARRGPGCRAWVTVHPTGWVCDDEGIDVREREIEIEEPMLEGWKEDQVAEAAARGALVLLRPACDEMFFYDYYYV